MDEKVAQQIFDGLLPSLEALDTKCAALLQFLKDKEKVSDEELAPYFEQAGNASGVRWRAARVRINHLLSATKSPEQITGTPSTKAPDKTPEPAADTRPEAAPGSGEKDVQGPQNVADNANAGKEVAPDAEKNQNKQGQKDNQSEHVDKTAA
jgi:hypothetical protein